MNPSWSWSHTQSPCWLQLHSWTITVTGAARPPLASFAPNLPRQPNAIRYQWRRQRGRGGEAPPYGWTSKNYVICVCFHGHGTSSYHTTNTLQGRRAKSYVDTQTLIQYEVPQSRCIQRDWGTSYCRPPIDPYLTSPLLQNPGGATVRYDELF